MTADASSLSPGARLRWQVKYSRWTPTWFHACEVVFVDASNAEEAMSLVNGLPSEDTVRAWSVLPATPEMEANHLAWLARCERWRVAATTASAHRGML